MANNISASCNLSLSMGTTALGGTASLSAAQVGSTGLANVQDIGTGAETITFVDAVPSGGYLMLINQDSTNYVEIDSVNTFNSFPQKITAGKFIFLMPQTSTIYAKANTAAVKLLVVAVTL
jgi:hypothetical protein